jgi:hypothetical protein
MAMANPAAAESQRRDCGRDKAAGNVLSISISFCFVPSICPEKRCCERHDNCSHQVEGGK